ncbi:DNA mismatch repair protein MutS [Sporolactobacillus spathodeae]|uniref:DNA mismatch repair protein MutS n=1 Tax=Sporolactobacillus spathodeae TaxID=1465502 RepID=A0ABS2Q5H0_9BACL|nr:DNA mismatch repair protein MutS [Sporolactobacillus spathodeae]MBM7657032.1 DNA mismatch repair protein MutS [Sporolactobacillus spathodeae]
MSYTPMIQQYLAIKAQYQDAFLFFRLGDFYELFFDDALKASKELEIALTSRNGGKDEYIPMCGVPYHAVKQYIKVLIDKGYKIAICEQMEDPKLAKGMVKREVIQMITPGTIMEDDSLQPKRNNYLAAISSFPDESFALAFSDLTTGEVKVTVVNGWDGVLQELDANDVRELVAASDFPQDSRMILNEQMNLTLSEEDETKIPEALQHLSAGIDQDKLLTALGRLLSYLTTTQKRSLDHLQQASVYHVQEYMMIDPHSRRNLELTQTNRGKKTYGSLLWLLDDVKTAMGGRRLKQWIEKPLLDQDKITTRLDAVDALKTHLLERETLRDALNGVYDLERLVGRVSFGNVNPREVVQLKRSLDQIPAIKKTLAAIPAPALQDYAQEMDPCESVRALIEQAIVDDPPFTTSDGGMIRAGYDETLDRYRDASKNGKRWIAELEAREREETGIKSLKIGYNRVFGYYIEVSRPNLKLIPEGRYERRQTLSNAERFITPELKEKERVILEAEEKRVGLEFQLFGDVRLKIKNEAARLQQLARLVSALDVLQSFASVSDANNYIRPDFSNDRTVAIKDSRHPVIEKVMKNGFFVANDIQMDQSCDMLLITGPNMGGKSTYMRQAALTAIMAQSGCFVPADSACLPIYDQIFTRIGAADDLVSGQSTFMVEMDEAKYALTHATQNSLILLDEIGRGTSTYDGIAIAQAIVEYIHDHIAAKTFFSTHYHELTFLDKKLKRLKNVHVGAMEENGNVVFLHKVLKGQADKSYGIHVAKLAGLPDPLIARADAILQELEAEKQTAPAEAREAVVQATAATEVDEPAQLAFFNEPEGTDMKKPAKKEQKVLRELEKIDLMTMTPMDAMNKLYNLQRALKH